MCSTITPTTTPRKLTRTQSFDRAQFQYLNDDFSFLSEKLSLVPAGKTQYQKSPYSKICPKKSPTPIADQLKQFQHQKNKKKNQPQKEKPCNYVKKMTVVKMKPKKTRLRRSKSLVLQQGKKNGHTRNNKNRNGLQSSNKTKDLITSAAMHLELLQEAIEADNDSEELQQQHIENNQETNFKKKTNLSKKLIQRINKKKDKNNQFLTMTNNIIKDLNKDLKQLSNENNDLLKIEEENKKKIKKLETKLSVMQKMNVNKSIKHQLNMNKINELNQQITIAQHENRYLKQNELRLHHQYCNKINELEKRLELLKLKNSSLLTQQSWNKQAIDIHQQNGNNAVQTQIITLQNTIKTCQEFVDQELHELNGSSETPQKVLQNNTSANNQKKKNLNISPTKSKSNDILFDTKLLWTEERIKELKENNKELNIFKTIQNNDFLKLNELSVETLISIINRLKNKLSEQERRRIENYNEYQSTISKIQTDEKKLIHQLQKLYKILNDDIDVNYYKYSNGKRDVLREKLKEWKADIDAKCFKHYNGNKTNVNNNINDDSMWGTICIWARSFSKS